MRVIAGEAGRVPLAAPAGHGTRPTSDKVKGAIFSSLGERGCEGRVLDLFAGSGALGIEALSRGATSCDFVESAAPACKVIQANLAKTKLADRGRVHCLPVTRFLSRAVANHEPPYALVLLDPPYALPELEALLETLASSPMVEGKTALLVEHASRRSLPGTVGRFQAVKTREHGDSAFTLYLASD